MIYLLRHGEAEDGDGKPDAERELTEKGRRQAEWAGRGLAALGVELDACLTSPKVRARDTAAIACEHLAVEPEETRELAGGMIDSRALATGRGEVLLVGHEPDFSDEVAHLTGGQIKLKKGGLAAFDGRLLHLLLRPKDLRAISAG
jgi:phosphohistidine phosphatase